MSHTMPEVGYVKRADDTTYVQTTRSRKSTAVGDIVPLNRGNILDDIKLLQKYVSSVNSNVTSLGDKHAELISSETDEIKDQLHNISYFLCSMRESLFVFSSCDFCKVPPECPTETMKCPADDSKVDDSVKAPKRQNTTEGKDVPDTSNSTVLAEVTPKQVPDN